MLTNFLDNRFESLIFFIEVVAVDDHAGESRSRWRGLERGQVTRWKIAFTFDPGGIGSLG